MTAEQVLRAMLVKQMNGYSYEELAFRLADSNTYRTFCRIGIDEKAPTKSRLQKNGKRISRCGWSGFDSFNAYVCGSVLACNLLIVARHMLAPTA